MYNITIKSVPKHAPANTTPANQQWNIQEINKARELIIEQRSMHSKKSQWFEIYQDDKLIFNSRMQHNK